MPISFGVTSWRCCGRTQLLRLDASARTGLVASLQRRCRGWLASINAGRFASLLPWAVPVWMAGVAAFLVYRFASWIAAQRLRRLGACAAPEEWSRRVVDLAARLKISRHVALLESCLAEVPMLIGYLRPVILVPIGMLAALPIDQVEAILLHELAHIRRADYLVNLLQTAIESVLFYHPAVWWISSVVRAERENCCDDFVLARDTDPRAYAAALIALEQGRGESMALAANDGNLVRRVRRVLRAPAPLESKVVMGPVALVIVGAGIAFAAWQPTAGKETLGVKGSVTPVASVPSRYKLVIDGPHPIDGPHQIAQAQSTPQRKQGTAGVLVPESSSLVFSRWNDEVRYIITDQERAAWDKLGSDAEREKFIEQFWERRDPTPGTVENEYREEHYRRIAYTNQRFGFADHAGSFSVRGRTSPDHGCGPPDEIESHPTGGSYQRPAEQGGGTTSTYPFEKWRYRWIEGIGNNVIIEFVDTTRNGEYRMSMDPSAKDASMYVPEATKQAWGTRRFSRGRWGAEGLRAPSLEKLKSGLENTKRSACNAAGELQSRAPRGEENFNCRSKPWNFTDRPFVAQCGPALPDRGRCRSRHK